MAMEYITQVGVVGCGSIGARYAKWLVDLGVQVGVYDADEKKRNDLNVEGVQIFSDLSGLFDWGPDKLVISTPPAHHKEVAISAMENGAEILIEKPLATSIDEVEEIEKYSDRLGRKARGVCNMRYHPAIKVIREALPKIGRPLSARALFSHRLSQMRPEGLEVYAASSADGGGVILDCIHEMDIMRWLLGALTNIRGWSEQIGDEIIHADDIADIQIRFKSGCHGTAHFDFLSKLKRRGLEIVGVNATIIWESVGKNPENCKVIIGDDKGFETIFDDSSLDGEVPYKDMLKDFLSFNENTQTIKEGKLALEASLMASNESWTTVSSR